MTLDEFKSRIDSIMRRMVDDTTAVMADGVAAKLDAELMMMISVRSMQLHMESADNIRESRG